MLPPTGELTVKCTGPRREPVPCKLIDNFDGTRRLKVTPSTTGRHIVEIKYDNEHIMGTYPDLGYKIVRFPK